MKHTLQWKFIGIMFLSLFCGIFFLALVQWLFYGCMQGLTAEETEAAIASYSYVFDLFFVAVVIVAFLLLSRRIIKRIERMNRNVEQIAAGNMQELTVDRKRDELGNLSGNINVMAEKIAASLEKERMMICNVAHDLRTPVTSIQGYAQLLEKSPELTEQNRSYVSIIQNKSVSLSKQIEELLEYSVLQFEEKEYTFETLSLRKLIEQVLIEFVPQLEKEQMSFSVTGNREELLMECNQMLMVRLFENLFGNSIRYGKKGKILEVELSEKEDKNRVAVSNYGNPIGKEEREHLFEAFYRGQGAKDDQIQSKGLGLAIARRIVLLHHGSIWADSEEATGKTTFYIEFPKLL